MNFLDLLVLQVEFSDSNDGSDEEAIEQCVNASLIVDIFGNNFNGEQLLEGLYELDVDMDDYADIVENNLALFGLIR